MTQRPRAAKVNLLGYGLVTLAVFDLCATTPTWLGIGVGIVLALLGVGIVLRPGLQQKSGLAALAARLCVIAIWTLGASLAFVSSAT